jgi:hypothetical protein
MDKFTYNSLMNSTSTLQKRFDLICKVLQIEPSTSTVTEISNTATPTTTTPTPTPTDNNNLPLTTENSNPMTSQDENTDSIEDDPLSIMYETITKLTSSPSSDTTPP